MEELINMIATDSSASEVTDKIKDLSISTRGLFVLDTFSRLISLFKILKETKRAKRTVRPM
jgi:hypothetical protein